MVEFISYDGKCPNLCSGTLVLRIDGVERVMPPYCMNSGGWIRFGKDGGEHIDKGMWSVDIPEDLANRKAEIEECVNANIPYGCCGGCF